MKDLVDEHGEKDLRKAAEELTEVGWVGAHPHEHGSESMFGGMDPSDPRRPGASRRAGVKSESVARLGGVKNRRNARLGSQRGRRAAKQMARRGVESARAARRGPQDAYVQPQDTRTIWNPHTHGEFVIYWHRIFKYSFKTLFMIIGSNSYVATAVGALTVGQLFGTLDKLLITIVSVAIGTTCAGVATYTGAAAATIALYTLIRGAYDRVVGQSREDIQVNIANECRGVDQNIRGHVVETAQELNGLFNSPNFLQLIEAINSTADFASGACAARATSIFIRKIYRPPLLTPEQIAQAPEGADPWNFAMAKRREPTGDGDQINLFDKHGAVSIPVIFPVDEIAAEEEGRTKTMAVIDMGSGFISLPQQIQADRAAANREKIVIDLSSAFSRGGIDGSEAIVDILGMNLITAFHDYLTQMEGNPDPGEIPPEQLNYYLNIFLSQWEEPIPEEAAEAFLQQEAILPEGDGGEQQQPELEPEMQEGDGNIPSALQNAPEPQPFQPPA